MVLCQGLNQSEASLITLVQSLCECHRITLVVGVRNSALILGQKGLKSEKKYGIFLQVIMKLREHITSHSAEEQRIEKRNCCRMLKNSYTE